MTAILVTSGYDMTLAQNSQSDKNSFLALLRKASGSDSPDIALLCSIDFLKAASILSTEDCTVLRAHAAALESNLVEKVFNVKSTYLKAPDSEDQIIDINAMVELVCCISKLNEQFTMKSIFPLLVDNSPLNFKGIFIGACYHAVIKLWFNRGTPMVTATSPFLRRCFFSIYSVKCMFTLGCTSTGAKRS
jgi:hypothetical protein